MTQSFDEWFGTTTYRGYVDENDMESAWDAGAQSKQAEIDELRKRIDFLENVICENLDERFLKGTTNEQ